MRIRILLLSLALLLANPTSAKTVYLLVFTDDNDASIGSSCAQTRKYMSNTFVQHQALYKFTCR